MMIMPRFITRATSPTTHQEAVHRNADRTVAELAVQDQVAPASTVALEEVDSLAAAVGHGGNRLLQQRPQDCQHQEEPEAEPQLQLALPLPQAQPWQEAAPTAALASPPMADAASPASHAMPWKADSLQALLRAPS